MVEYLFFNFKSMYYEESIFVGYRYFESAKQEVLFPFGYGLSYAKFEYSNINILFHSEPCAFQ